MTNIKIECPVHEHPLLDSLTCPHCDYKVIKNNDGKLDFSCARAKAGIYESYDAAYDQISSDDLETSVYAQEYQFALAAETKNRIGCVNHLDVAELGVGQGFLQREFLKESPKTLLALDIASDYIDNAKEVFKDSGKSSTNFMTSVGNVEFMPFRESFDLVVATDIIEHVLNLANALVCISRSLKSGGKFACRVPYKEVLGQYSIYNKQKYSFSHLRFFDESLLTAQLLDVGLKPLKFYRYGFIQGRFSKTVPRFFHEYLYHLLTTTKLYGTKWYDFSIKSRRYPSRLVRFLHQPLELLVIAQKI